MDDRARPAMRVERLWLTGFRSYEQAEVSFHPGFNAVLGPNGEGKTNLLEAIAYLSRQQSFRGAPPAAMVGRSAPGEPDRTAAYVRGQLVAGERELLVEAEIPVAGRPRVQLNGKRVARRGDLLAAFQVSVFTPEDLVVVKGGPAVRRELLDDLLVATHPRHDAVVGDVERILRQRNALLKQMGGRTSPETTTTLDVWDERLAVAGERLGQLRADLVARLAPVVDRAYRDLAGGSATTSLRYEAPWRVTGLRTALAEGRRDDVRRGLSLVGPHRDDLVIGLDGLEARHQASQGEQRSLAFALRLAAHRLVIEELGTVPVLLLDDVFSELDPARSAALLRSLPAGQVVLTSAVGLPEGATPDLVLEVAGGRVDTRTAR
jgi:DNA replication and repair protein RecF